MIFLFHACSAEQARLGVAVPPDLQTYRCGLRGEFGKRMMSAMAGKTARDDAGKLRWRAPGGWRFKVQKAWLALACCALVAESIRYNSPLFQLRRPTAA